MYFRRCTWEERGKYPPQSCGSPLKKTHTKNTRLKYTVLSSGGSFLLRYRRRRMVPSPLLSGGSVLLLPPSSSGGPSSPALLLPRRCWVVPSSSPLNVAGWSLLLPCHRHRLVVPCPPPSSSVTRSCPRCRRVVHLQL